MFYPFFLWQELFLFLVLWYCFQILFCSTSPYIAPWWSSPIRRLLLLGEHFGVNSCVACLTSFSPWHGHFVSNYISWSQFLVRVATFVVELLKEPFYQGSTLVVQSTLTLIYAFERDWIPLYLHTNLIVQDICIDFHCILIVQVFQFYLHGLNVSNVLILYADLI